MDTITGSQMMKNNRQVEDKKVTRAILTVALAAAFTLPLQSCNEDVPVAEPFAAPPAEVIRVPVEELDADTKEAVILGGRLYDDWFSVVTSATVPSDVNPMAVFIGGYLATPQDRTLYDEFVGLDGVDPLKPTKPKQYRCKTCHGFNYAGSDYFDAGIMGAADNMTLEEIQAVIKDGFTLSFGSDTTKQNVPVHGFGDLGLGDTAISELASFIKYGVVNVDEYFYPTSPKIGRGDSANGEKLFQQTVGCARSSCHGADGKKIPFGPAEFVGTIGQNEPDEMLHKIRFGQPSEPRDGMPSIYDKALTTQDAADIMTYTQKLPAQ
ncbi:MAG: cytochrome c [Gammaproteobacteria bacterium]|nr:cytochrome c [Gammaproteobacteria bacterium]